MSKSFQFLNQHLSRFTQLSEYEGFDTSLSEAMLLEHVPATVLHLLSHHRYLPELIVINVGMSDFLRFSNSQQRNNIRYMVRACKALTQKVEHQSDHFKGIFLNLMISLPWYIGWESQRAARRAGARFNGCLASTARDHGCYIIHHDGIVASMGQGLYDPQNPGDLVTSMFLADIVILVKKVCKPFQVAQEARMVPFKMSKAIHRQSLRQAVQALHISQHL